MAGIRAHCLEGALEPPTDPLPTHGRYRIRIAPLPSSTVEAHCPGLGHARSSRNTDTSPAGSRSADFSGRASRIVFARSARACDHDRGSLHTDSFRADVGRRAGVAVVARTGVVVMEAARGRVAAVIRADIAVVAVGRQAAVWV